MKRLILILTFLLTPTICYATPSISSITGNLTHGNSVVISGSDFGADQTPILYDNFEGGTDDLTIVGENPVVGAAWGGYSVGGKIQPRYSNDIARGQSVYSSLHDYTSYNASTWQCSLSQALSQTEYYITFLRYYDKQGSIWSRNNKPLGIRGSSGSGYPDTYFGYGRPTDGDGTARAVSIDNGSVSDGTWYGTHNLTDVEGGWHRWEFYVKQSSNNQYDGIVQSWLDGTVCTSDDAARTRTTTDYFNDIRIEYFNDREAGQSDVVYVDDVYINDSQARVVIGNNGTWANCTNRAIQLPTAWADGEITITMNQDVWTAGTTVYLYVIDSAGTVSSSYELEVGETGEPPEDPDPPSATGGFTRIITGRISSGRL